MIFGSLSVTFVLVIVLWWRLFGGELWPLEPAVTSLGLAYRWSQVWVLLKQPYHHLFKALADFLIVVRQNFVFDFRCDLVW